MNKNKNWLVWICLVAPLALLTASCAPKADNITVMANSPEVRGISVSGTGEVEAPPDTGFFTIGVQVQKATVAEARDGAAAAAEAVTKSLKKNGIDEKDIKTIGLSIQPVYDYSKSGQEPRITGYQVSNSVSVKVRKLDSMSKAVDDGIAAGGDAVRLQSISFVIEDDKALIEKAREMAVKDARAKAEQLAAAAGTKLGPLQTLSEQQVSGDIPANGDLFYAAGLKESVSTPIQPGTGIVRVTVSARWAIE